MSVRGGDVGSGGSLIFFSEKGQAVWDLIKKIMNLFLQCPLHGAPDKLLYALRVLRVHMMIFDMSM